MSTVVNTAALDAPANAHHSNAARVPPGSRPAQLPWPQTQTAGQEPGDTQTNFAAARYSTQPDAPADRDSPYAPAALAAPPTPPIHFIELPSVPIDELLDDHAAELAEIRRWASSDAGQIARAQNPLGFANVRAHALAHQSAIARQSAQAAQQQAAAAALASAAKRSTKPQR